MAFKLIAPGKFGARARAQQSVTISFAGPGRRQVAFFISDDVARDVGLLPGARAKVLIGDGPDFGRVGLLKSVGSDNQAYSIYRATKSALQVKIGVRRSAFPDLMLDGQTPCSFEITEDRELIVTIPPEVIVRVPPVQRPRKSPLASALQAAE